MSSLREAPPAEAARDEAGEPLAAPHEAPRNAAARPGLAARALAVAAASLALVAVAAVLVALALALRLRTLAGALPAERTSSVSVAASPDVLVAVRELSRLETASFHMERVVEVTDEQRRLWGLLDARDRLSLLAVGEVVAGVDLARLREGDIDVRWDARAITLRLPAPEVLFARVDAQRTRVLTRATDTLAARNEGLEARARADAERSMREGALEAGLLEHARRGGEQQLRALLRGLGFARVELRWAER